MNHADRVIAEAKQTVQDYRAFLEQHPEAARLLRKFEDAYRATLHLPNVYVRDVIPPEEIDIVSEYQRLRACVETAKYTLQVYGVEVGQ